MKNKINMEVIVELRNENFIGMRMCNLLEMKDN